MKVIVGLGNPGEKYQNTWHNVGFKILDKLQETFIFPDFKIDKKFSAERTNDLEIHLLKPLVFMNKSGLTVSQFLNYFKIKPENLIIIHDDVDLQLGTVKISFGEGAAGHKGVESIISVLGSQDFWRIRVGILNKPKEEINTEKFVLEKFSRKESEILEKIIYNVIAEIKMGLREGFKATKTSV